MLQGITVLACGPNSFACIFMDGDTPAVDGPGNAMRVKHALLRLTSIAAAVAIVVAFAIDTGPERTGERACAPSGSVVAIADLHGDINKAKQALRIACLIDENGSWVAEGVTAVQLGDIVDRGPDSWGLLRYMHDLQDQAKQHNSSLILLTGNHELFNLRGDYRYVAPEELIHLGIQQQQQSRSDASDLPGISSSKPSADDARAYAAGLEAWTMLWQLPSAIPAAAAAGTMADPIAPAEQYPIDDSSSNSSSSLRGYSAVSSVRRSIAEHHRLMFIHGQGGPCATGFVHAGLLPFIFEELLGLARQSLLISNPTSSSSGSSAAPGTNDNDLTQYADQGHHIHLHQQQQQQHRHESLAPGRSGVSSSGQQDVAVGAVSILELQHLNKLSQQAIASCDSQQCVTNLSSSSSSSDEAHVHKFWAALWGQHSPVWTRDQAQGPESRVCRHLEQVLQLLNVRRLIVGHTPQESGRATARCGGKLLLLDTGMSSGMMDAPAAAWICNTVSNSLSEVDNVGDSSTVDGGDASLSDITQRSEGGGVGKDQQRYKTAWSAVVYADGVVQTV